MREVNRESLRDVGIRRLTRHLDEEFAGLREGGPVDRGDLRHIPDSEFITRCCAS